jgi:uncharacterized radical SAM superfamily Fe-S cluster-containing enzyme
MADFLLCPECTQLIDARIFEDGGKVVMEKTCPGAQGGQAKDPVLHQALGLNSLRHFFYEDKAPQDLTFNKFLQTLQGMTDKRYGRGSSEQKGFSYRTLMLAGMHFMDSYNYDIERVKRCVIHYAAPNGLIYPFCA